MYILDRDIFSKSSLYQYQKIPGQEFFSLQFSSKLTNHETNYMDLIYKTLILKSRCQHARFFWWEIRENLFS